MVELFNGQFPRSHFMVPILSLGVFLCPCYTFLRESKKPGDEESSFNPHSWPCLRENRLTGSLLTWAFLLMTEREGCILSLWHLVTRHNACWLWSERFSIKSSSFACHGVASSIEGIFSYRAIHNGDAGNYIIRRYGSGKTMLVTSH